MEEPTKAEPPSESPADTSNLEPLIKPESSESSVPSDVCKSEDVPTNDTKLAELDNNSPGLLESTPKTCESTSDKTNQACEPSSQPIDVPTSSHSGGELDSCKLPEPPTNGKPPSHFQPSDSFIVRSLDPIKSDCPDSSKSEVEISKTSSTPSNSACESPKLSAVPSESGIESPKSDHPSESGIESPKSDYASESGIESPKSIASNESEPFTGSDAKSVESNESPKSGSSTDARRKSKLVASYSIRRESKVKLLADQLDLVASEREKDIMVKQEFKEKEESLKDKRESIYKKMHMEERKAKMERKASTRKGSSLMTDFNASKRDMRKDDLNRKKEEDERNKQLLLQRARDEKMLRKSIYAADKISSGSSSPTSSSPLSSSSPPNSSSPLPEERD